MFRIPNKSTVDIETYCLTKPHMAPTPPMDTPTPAGPRKPSEECSTQARTKKNPGPLDLKSCTKSALVSIHNVVLATFGS